jgi:hypothetical protein
LLNWRHYCFVSPWQQRIFGCNYVTELLFHFRLKSSEWRGLRISTVQSLLWVI